eukprot:6205067-Pleurochrysis_carterae.AAC.1
MSACLPNQTPLYVVGSTHGCLPTSRQTSTIREPVLPASTDSHSLSFARSLRTAPRCVPTALARRAANPGGAPLPDPHALSPSGALLPSTSLLTPTPPMLTPTHHL